MFWPSVGLAQNSYFLYMLEAEPNISKSQNQDGLEFKFLLLKVNFFGGKTDYKFTTNKDNNKSIHFKPL